MFQHTPIYSRLIAEHGDVPAQVRGEADRIHRHLAQTMHLPAPHAAPTPGPLHAASRPGPGRLAAAP
ncbi:hypothetical protein GCM10010206_76640 [Streptomyces cinerochromogenes]|nr:hypothetical protein [Streptomyces cinerochromogenes]GGT02692.1 hypothetical protein GCM10010206_76640 [Streptomyces cinerochromogenes]